jgi:hypothetical protein
MRRRGTSSTALVSDDGVWRVEPVVLQKDLRRPPRTYLRVTWMGSYRGGFATVAELARLVPLAELRPEDAS